ncbi:unnamed protein product [Rotaria sordida]|uniref:Uncharacterized protein n=1 Tax=Rotaria sordida TaxID=392033 RepID=A0A814ANW6_9BILA|nr:unnamed protein product [Rotaria sordida]CAF1087648.1 unnamed protein product [Rotaria sordida]
MDPYIYSLRFPSNKDDQRRLSIVKNGYMTSVGSNIKRTEHIEHVKITKSDELIELKTRFHRVLIGSIQSIVQPYIHHLIVERRLIDKQEISSLAHLRCFQVLFCMDGSSDNKLRFWSELIDFLAKYAYGQSNGILSPVILYTKLYQKLNKE